MPEIYSRGTGYHAVKAMAKGNAEAVKASVVGADYDLEGALKNLSGRTVKGAPVFH